MDGHHAVMREIELKFQVPTERRAAVDAAVAGRTPAPRVRLQAAYFDTPQRSLAEAGLALRIRREGRRWVQTLKGAGADGLTRAEHNVMLPPGPHADALADPQRHAGTEVGERLLDLLGRHEKAPLQCLFRTDIRRRTRALRTRQGMVELAFDEGHIVAGERQLPVCELEIELLSGSPLAVIATARRWVQQHHLHLDTRSKAERGDMLARGDTVAPPRKAQPVALASGMSLAQGLRGVLLSCQDQIAVNASQVASGEYDGEHVHQLRIGLRRLRSALRLFEEPATAMPLLAGMADSAASLFRALGAARDLVAIAGPTERELAAALEAAGLHFETPRLAPPADAAEPGALMRTPPAQRLLLDLYEATQTEPAPALEGEASLGEFVGQRLDRWHRRVRRDAGQFASLDDAARHRLRKRAKRLRYGIEFGEALFERRRVRRCLKPLRAMQDRLGELVDLTVALDAYRVSSDRDPHALFAVGWLAARKERLLRDSRREMAAFADSKRLWKP
jgi:triphosphatase